MGQYHKEQESAERAEPSMAKVTATRAVKSILILSDYNPIDKHP